MNAITLDDRLMSAAEYVRQDAILADIGTDHALLPIFLLKSGRIKRAALADINEGPLDAARLNAQAYGVTDDVSLHLTDGAQALDGLGITDYTVCGMGGELIASIIEAAPHLCKEGVRLILQPMTRPSALRIALARLGFRILSETYTEAAGKHYVTMMAEYSGEAYELDSLGAELGYSEIKNPGAHLSYLKVRLKAFLKMKRGKELRGTPDSELAELVSRAEAMISEYEGELK